MLTLARGGHFAAMERPVEFVDDLLEFVAVVRSSQGP